MVGATLSPQGVAANETSGEDEQEIHAQHFKTSRGQHAAGFRSSEGNGVTIETRLNPVRLSPLYVPRIESDS